MVEKLGLFYDRVRWEEKALYNKGKAMGIDIKFIDVKDIELNAVSAMLGLLLARLVGEKKEGDGRA